MCQIERWMGYEYLPRKKKTITKWKTTTKQKKHKLKKKQTNKPDIGALTKFGIMLNVQVY